MQYKPPSWKMLLLTAITAVLAAVSLTLYNPVEVRVDGQPMLSDVPPVRTGADTVYVPLRSLGDALGAETRYEPKSGDIYLTRGDQLLHLRIGDVHATLNGMPMTFRRAPFRVRGRAMLSLRSVQRAFGVRVRFDKNTSRVEVNTPGTAAAP